MKVHMNLWAWFQKKYHQGLIRKNKKNTVPQIPQCWKCVNIFIQAWQKFCWCLAAVSSEATHLHSESVQKVLLAGLRSFVHLLNGSTDKLWKGYAPVWVLGHRSIQLRRPCVAFVRPCSVPSATFQRQTIFHKSQVCNRGK